MVRRTSSALQQPRRIGRHSTFGQDLSFPVVVPFAASATVFPWRLPLPASELHFGEIDGVGIDHGRAVARPGNIPVRHCRDRGRTCPSAAPVPTFSACAGCPFPGSSAGPYCSGSRACCAIAAMPGPSGKCRISRTRTSSAAISGFSISLLNCAEKPHRLGGDLDLLVVPLQPGPVFGVALRDLVLPGRKPDRLLRSAGRSPLQAACRGHNLAVFRRISRRAGTGAVFPPDRPPRSGCRPRLSGIRQRPREVTTMRSSAMVLPSLLGLTAGQTAALGHPAASVSLRMAPGNRGA